MSKRADDLKASFLTALAEKEKPRIAASVSISLLHMLGSKASSSNAYSFPNESGRTAMLDNALAHLFGTRAASKPEYFYAMYEDLGVATARHNKFQKEALEIKRQAAERQNNSNATLEEQDQCYDLMKEMDAMLEAVACLRKDIFPHDYVVRMAEQQGALPQKHSADLTHSPDYRSITKNGEEFSLTPRQASIIELLHKAYKNGAPELSQAYIFETIGTASDNPRIRDTFKRNTEARKALIATGNGKDLIRLNI